MTSKLILLVGLFAVITPKFSPTLYAPTTTAAAEHDPIKAFKKLVAAFPKRSIWKSSKEPYDIVNVTFDVKKTDSLINPVVGIINFTTDNTVVGEPIQIDMQMVFHWHDDHWTFEQLLTRRNGSDATHSGLGEDILGAGPMLDFLKPLQ